MYDILIIEIIFKNNLMIQVNKAFSYSKKGTKGNIVFLCIVIWITIGFTAYNFFLEKEVISIQQKVIQHENTIKELESQRKVHIYSLLKLHESTLSEMDERSNITKYIDHLDMMKNKYNLEFRGFKINNGTIVSKVIFETNDTWVAYKKASRFISDYRENTKALLDLDFISNLSWAENDIKFPVLFTLKK